MPIPDHYLEKIRSVHPNLSLDQVELNQDGINNDVVIINREWVCRFPRTDWAKQDLATEAKALHLIEHWVDSEIVVPQFEHLEADFVTYRFIKGEPLSRHRLLCLGAEAQERAIAQIGHFYRQLHQIPLDVLESAEIPPSPVVRDREEMLEFYQAVRQTLFPYLWKHQRTWIEQHFEPLLNGILDLSYRPVLIHGDLGCYHILFDTDAEFINGLIDFGTTGIGSAAIDIAGLLDTYGETIVRRIAYYYPEIEQVIDQARFAAGGIQLQWALAGMKHNDTAMRLAHLGHSALDLYPLGSPLR